MDDGITRRVLASMVAGTAVAAALPAAAQTAFPATERKCATCDFWKGARTASADKASVSVASGARGICGNPQSPLFNKESRADQVFANGWKRWSALG